MSFFMYKMSAHTQQASYQKNRDLILNKAKVYYENNKDRICKQIKALEKCS